MTFDKYLESAKLHGNVKDLMTKGLAVEFIQPWYTPLTTTPATTGIAVGGIGSTYTVTPAGTTPVTGVIPGVQVRTTNPDDLRLQNVSTANRSLSKMRPSPFAISSNSIVKINFTH